MPKNVQIYHENVIVSRKNVQIITILQKKSHNMIDIV